MHAILLSMGTDGDIYPYLGIGTTLRSRGHRVTLLANEQFQALAADHGLDFYALVSKEEHDEVLANPDIWHPLRSARLGAQWGVRFLGRQYALVAELARGPDVVLVASPAIFAARLVQEKLSRPLASVILQPWVIPSVDAPPVMPGGLSLPPGLPRPVGRLYWRLVDGAGDLLVGRHLNQLRISLGLERTRRVFQWWLSPEMVIGMFPDWYGPPQADWPSQIRLAGFPMYDGRPAESLAPEVLEFCRAGTPPVAVTCGTGMMHARETFRAALEACRTLRLRGVFLTKYKHQLPAPLPASVRHFQFAPFTQLFPHCGAVVHHGGVGTAAKALASGTPQLVLPLAFDQLDNAKRIARLGVGQWLKSNQRSSSHIAAALANLMTPQTRSRCRQIAAHFGDHDALQRAAQWIEEFAIAHCAAGTAGQRPPRPQHQ